MCVYRITVTYLKIFASPKAPTVGDMKPYRGDLSSYGYNAQG